MTYPVPTLQSLAQRFAAGLAQQQFTASDGSTVTLDATAPQTLEQALAILDGLSAYEVYLFLRDVALELMVTTATESGLLPQHAQIWGVPREGATSAVGNFVVQSSANADVTLPVGTLFTVDGTSQWAVTAETTIAPNAAASVPVQATASGVTGNLAANTAAQLLSPIAGVQSVVSDQDGLAGGAPIEAVENWRARIIAVIRDRSSGGTLANYNQWATAAGAQYVRSISAYNGPGTVGIVVAMAGPAAPTAAQIAKIQSYIDSVRPARGNATVYAAGIVAQDMTIALNPNTLSAQAAVQAALAPVYIAAGIGAQNTSGRITLAALEAAISAVAGTGNDLVSPSADIVPEIDQLTVLGNITWQTEGAS